MSIPRTGVIIKHKSTETYLCVFQSASRLWGYPKGRINLSEEYKIGACRELFEETNIHIYPEYLDYNNMIHIKRGKHHHYYFILEVDEKPNVIVDMYEIIDYKWMNLEELEKEKTSFFTEQVIKRLKM
jgi:8-oxo-dGTP pyrophosphatase MutT (NUDIX family)